VPVCRRTFLGLLLALALFGIAAGPVSAGECRPVRQWQLDFVDAADGGMLTRQMLGDGHVYLAFDTGAIAHLLFADQADALHLRRGHGSRPIVGAGGTVSDAAVVDPVSLREYFVVPRGRGGDPREAGVLGAPLYSDHDLELDFQARKINLYLPEHCDAGRAYRAPDFVAVPLRSDQFGRAFVTVTLDGRPLNALIDTGATDTTMSLAVAQRLFGLSPGGTGTDRIGAGRDIHGNLLTTYRHRFRALNLGRLHIAAPQVDLADAACEPGVDLILGMSELRRMRLFFAFRERKLYAKLAVP
jgi:hypothetical protein